jgi:peroxiredoxin/mono/diheme cytochrome c family protein
MPPALIAAWAALWAGPVADFELPDPAGVPVRLSVHAPDRPAVLVFLGTECPLANLYAPRLAALARTLEPRGVRLLAIDPVPQDTPADRARFTREQHLPFPILKDPDARVAGRCGVTRMSEVVLLDAGRRIRYRGRVDDQYEPGGKNRGKPNRHDLAIAIDELLAGKPVSVPETPAFGCLIPRPRPTRPDAGVTYHRDIAPLLQAKCQACHRPGEVAPFALLTYADARHWGPMMVEVTANGTMPPWHANPEFGHFRNERRLSAAQKDLIAKWVEAGSPEGDTADGPPPVRWPDGWAIGTPDLVLKMPKPFRVPAEGVIEYQHVIVDTGAATDLWVKAIEVRPGNRRVLHHCNVYLQPPGEHDPTQTFVTVGPFGSDSVAAYAPGTGPTRYPPGMAKVIPAGWKLHLGLHYTPIGTPASDQTEIGLQFADPRDVRRRVVSKVIEDKALRIPPGAAAYRVEHSYRLQTSGVLVSLFPHLHFRGKAFRYVAEYPDGSAEVLLDVPAYDFNWQHRYELAEPKPLAAGTEIRCVAVYDNSAANPYNPDPTREVPYGEQVWDEMFYAGFEIALSDEDVRAAEPRPVWSARRPFVWGGAALLMVGLGMYRWRIRHRAEV